MIRRGARGLPLLLAALVVAGCGSSHKTEAPARQTLKVGYAYGFDAGAVTTKIGLQRLKSHGVDVKLRDMGGEQAAIAALARGDIDISETSYAGAIAAIEQGAKLRLVLTERRVLEFLLVARKGINTLADLRGKRIAEDGPGGGGTVFVTTALERAGLTAKDVTLITLRDSPSRATALAAGRIDASPLEFVDLERIRSKTPGLKVLATAAKVVPHEPLGVFTASQRVITQHPDVVQKFVNAVLEANAFFSTPAGERRWIADAKRTALAGDPQSLVQDTYDYYKRISLYPLRGETITPAEYRNSMRSFLAAKQVQRLDPFGAIWDVSFWRHAKPL